jgi:hypothetical protein
MYFHPTVYRIRTALMYYHLAVYKSCATLAL